MIPSSHISSRNFPFFESCIYHSTTLLIPSLCSGHCASACPAVVVKAKIDATAAPNNVLESRILKWKKHRENIFGQRNSLPDLSTI